MKILVIDSDRRSLEYLADQLERVYPNSFVIIHDNPLTAVKQLLAQPEDYDLIFTALLMPNIDGFDIMETARQFLPSTPLFLVTRTASWEFNKLALSRGAAGCLLFPPTPEAIEDTKKYLPTSIFTNRTPKTEHPFPHPHHSPH